MEPAPARWWVPWALRAGRAAELGARVVTAVRDEALAARLTEREQQALTLACYARSTTYSAGGTAFDAGLFDWELAALGHPAWPTAGTVLVGGAGAGREALALCERGHEVVAFEPCAPLAAQGRARAEREPRLSFAEASYADLVDAVTLRRGPLAPAFARAPFAAVLLGWGSVSHVLSRAERVALLTAARAVAPAGPVLLSFLTAWPRGEREQRARQLLRRALGAPAEPPSFSPEAGFFSPLDRAALAALAADAGYQVVLYREDPYAHALLTPA